MLMTTLVFLPLIGFMVNGLYHFSTIKSKGKGSTLFAGIIASGVMFASFVCALILFLRLKALPGEHPVIEETLFSWIHLGGLNVDFGFRFDSLSSIFTLVITGVGSLIHIYSVGYMGADGIARYFAYLNLFCFMMLNLVLGQTLPQVFLGWEGVGLASYLLIGFWHEDFANVMAAQKAFIMNRIGDLGFLIAMFVAFKFAGTLDLLALNHAALSPHVLTVFGLLVFFACTGKSAQIPLFTWLPDAMAGPTPVSALIHAATMVTSGVYLLGRLQPLISGSDTVLMVIATVGALTALISAITACFQSDIKKVLAYSTISQLGFMFVACGVGSFESGVFHVVTHAFFKALLFLGAGSVIHALSGDQNIFKMGGLRKKIPITFWTFTAGWAAILGLPPLSGFFSKDEIIYEALTSPHGNPYLFGAVLFAALLTAFYMTRLYVLVFFGKSRLSEKAKSHLHESPLVMTIPLGILALAAISGGWFGAPVPFPGHESASGMTTATVSPSFIMALSVAVACLGAWLGFSRYSKEVNEERVQDPIPVDRFYGIVFGRGTIGLSRVIGKYLEDNFIQRLIQISGAVVDLSGNLIRVFQTGSAQGYLMMMVLAMFGVLVWFIFGAGSYGNF